MKFQSAFEFAVTQMCVAARANANLSRMELAGAARLAPGDRRRVELSSARAFRRTAHQQRIAARTLQRALRHAPAQPFVARIAHALGVSHTARALAFLLARERGAEAAVRYLFKVAQPDVAR